MIEFIITKFNLSDLPDHSLKIIKRDIHYFILKVNARWLKSHRSTARFFQKNSKWLQGNIKLNISHKPPESSSLAETSNNSSKKQCDEEPSIKTRQKRRIYDMIKFCSPTELEVIAEVYAELTGKRECAKVVKRNPESPQTSFSALKKK